ncbi:putative selenium-dependent hydroxylase accessory protein YqeC [Sedimentibacter acidaminivorans]|uniref:Selenium-dependent hydroxylase accessory protein YqeC n=1 Tax=Sedimentibacter acidaminivorans TaxID=913099 RepID=A0ABS4GDK6_9FIRM|nr:selenium cofactor biosynthesis protein YqeC [Sedimentibacter acidaminivorans]MBP1925771.1 putative selenium-dependent hydroxylase accessory protein YqeC [Sedimentibacter acidaminivorans]
MKSKKISEIFNIKKGDIISIVGSGGKTTLMFELAKELKTQYKVLVTTSTKIYEPSCNNFDYLYTNIEQYTKSKYSHKQEENSVTVISKDIDLSKNKLIGINDECFDLVINDFDIVLVESDGSRNLPLKGWKEHEPSILLKTNKTVGVIPIDMMNKKINKEYIYGFEEFTKIVGDTDCLDKQAIGKICSSELGIFKNSRGKLYLYINKTDDKKFIEDSLNLSKYLKKNIVGRPYDFEICFGSLKLGEFYEN